MSSTRGVSATDATPPRRRYESPLRRQRAAATRESIVSAGAELLHGFPIWNWRALTVRTVAERAGVNERTVYRYFATERDLRDAVLIRLEEESGVDLEGLTLDGVREVTARMFEYVSTFPLEPRMARDPTVAAANQRQRKALLGAVASNSSKWSVADRTIAAAVLDVLWSVVSYERLVSDWDLRPEQAIQATEWVMQLVTDAVKAGEAPSMQRRQALSSPTRRKDGR
jgi:AcrR family transcriptional regulator